MSESMAVTKKRSKSMAAGRRCVPERNKMSIDDYDDVDWTGRWHGKAFTTEEEAVYHDMREN